MTSPQLAKQEIQEAIEAIMVVSDPQDTFRAIKIEEGWHTPLVEITFTPAEAIELANWIRSHTEPSRDNPWQQRFKFATD